jgi:hypothetical protein
MVMMMIPVLDSMQGDEYTDEKHIYGYDDDE